MGLARQPMKFALHFPTVGRLTKWFERTISVLPVLVYTAGETNEILRDAVGWFVGVWEYRALPPEDMFFVKEQRQQLPQVWYRSCEICRLLFLQQAMRENVTNLDLLTSSDHTLASIAFFSDFFS
jgi:hypothetical protein